MYLTPLLSVIFVMSFTSLKRIYKMLERFYLLGHDGGEAGWFTAEKVRLM